MEWSIGTKISFAEKGNFILGFGYLSALFLEMVALEYLQGIYSLTWEILGSRFQQFLSLCKIFAEKQCETVATQEKEWRIENWLEGGEGLRNTMYGNRSKVELEEKSKRREQKCWQKYLLFYLGLVELGTKGSIVVWRWPLYYRKEARDDLPFWWSGCLPKWRCPQLPP